MNTYFPKPIHDFLTSIHFNNNKLLYVYSIIFVEYKTV